MALSGLWKLEHGSNFINHSCCRDRIIAAPWIASFQRGYTLDPPTHYTTDNASCITHPPSQQDFERQEEERSDYLKDHLLKYVDLCVGVDEASADVSR